MSFEFICEALIVCLLLIVSSMISHLAAVSFNKLSTKVTFMQSVGNSAIRPVTNISRLAVNAGIDPGPLRTSPAISHGGTRAMGEPPSVLLLWIEANSAPAVPLVVAWLSASWSPLPPLAAGVATMLLPDVQLMAEVLEDWRPFLKFLSLEESRRLLKLIAALQRGRHRKQNHLS